MFLALPSSTSRSICLQASSTVTSVVSLPKNGAWIKNRSTYSIFMSSRPLTNDSYGPEGVVDRYLPPQPWFHLSVIQSLLRGTPDSAIALPTSMRVVYTSAVSRWVNLPSVSANLMMSTSDSSTESLRTGSPFFFFWCLVPLPNAMAGILSPVRARVNEGVDIRLQG
ncbi:hypothetical protein OGATHE_004923 [Ogataea polymorpha]|uniref:Uncharacterized protein n=1 Tax=Ogataea polymorpha TaxID=460523 RepID=A0A9P8T0G7_9ASCO|nr:hypothetical protein OGATHE_004923 [Ogataea polymorpha]